VPVLQELFAQADATVPPALGGWDESVALWLEEYWTVWPDALVDEILIETAVFLFDQINDRVVLAYGISTPQLTARDASRIRGFPNVNRAVQAELGTQAFLVDKGHYLGHASGGRLDINLFPHRRELNRGWSSEGKAFFAMERHAANAPGTFFYHRPLYDDASWIPGRLEYGVLVDGTDWWVSTFRNKSGAEQPPS